MSALTDLATFLVLPLLYFTFPLCLAVGASLFISPLARQLRTVGIGACYLSLLVGVFLLEWGAVVSAWLFLGATTGALYWGYEVVSHFGASPADKGRAPSAFTILHGTFAWPLMFPEVIEYTLSDIGMLDCSDGLDERRTE